MESKTIRIVDAESFDTATATHALDEKTYQQAEEIVSRVRSGGESSIREYATRFNERRDDQPLTIGPVEMADAAARLSSEDLDLLKRVATRIGDFAKAQRGSLSALEMDVPGGKAGHSIEPIARAGCYAPAGRFPLPSTVLMTVVTARVAGCESVVLATPDPSDLMLAAAHIAGADQVLTVGGAHAIAAMAYGFEGFERCDVIAGPGNRWVTAAKKIVSGDCGIDMLAGPSELVLIADDSADAATVATDLLGQAEHDVDARPFLITTSKALGEDVQAELEKQLETLPTSETARQSLSENGAIIVCESMDTVVRICNQLAPEHLELHCQSADEISTQIRNAGCIFIGHQSAEVFGDYGVGPNHTLPTSGTARFSAGLNVFTFLRIRTWLKLDSAPESLVRDTARLAELEGLAGHRASSLRRLPPE
ncbi:MAG: histidinol dehydrogenase [Planctomycetota bacterium]